MPLTHILLPSVESLKKHLREKKKKNQWAKERKEKSILLHQLIYSYPS